MRLTNHVREIEGTLRVSYSENGETLFPAVKKVNHFPLIIFTSVICHSMIQLEGRQVVIQATPRGTKCSGGSGTCCTSKLNRFLTNEKSQMIYGK